MHISVFVLQPRKKEKPRNRLQLAECILYTCQAMVFFACQVRRQTVVATIKVIQSCCFTCQIRAKTMFS